MIRNTKSRSKFDPQVRCSIPDVVVCDLEADALPTQPALIMLL